MITAQRDQNQQPNAPNMPQKVVGVKSERDIEHTEHASAVVPRGLRIDIPK
jgi:hypothetical protein